MTITHAVAGIDPHKRTATVAVVDVLGAVVTSGSFAVTELGIAELLSLLASTSLSIDRVGVEGSGGLGRPVMLALAAAGYDVREVQANRTADRRRRRSRAKTDVEDAEAIARETLSDPGLPPAGKDATPSPASDTLGVLQDWRESLVLQRVRLLTEAEPVLVSLPLQLREQLPATSRVLASLKRLAELENGDAALSSGDCLKLDQLADTLSDIVAISARIKKLDAQIPALLKAMGCSLTAIHGIGVVTAMTLLTEVADPHRFSTEARFARWCGVAPIAMSSAEGNGPPATTASTSAATARSTRSYTCSTSPRPAAIPRRSPTSLVAPGRTRPNEPLGEPTNDSSPTSSSGECGTTPTTSHVPTPPPQQRPLDKRASSRSMRLFVPEVGVMASGGW